MDTPDAPRTPGRSAQAPRRPLRSELKVVALSALVAFLLWFGGAFLLAGSIHNTGPGRPAPRDTIDALILDDPVLDAPSPGEESADRPFDPGI